MSATISETTFMPYRAASASEKIGALSVRYGLVIVIIWFAIMKFTAVEAEGIKPLVTGSPLLGWTYQFLSVTAFSRCLGLVELCIACLIALRPLSAKACAIGSAGAVMMFLSTLSFLLQAVSWDASLGGFPAPSAAVGEFLLKDIVLLGAALWSFGEAWTAVQQSRLAHPAA